MERISRRACLRGAAAAAVWAARPARAQPRYPTRPIQMIVPYAAGGTTDVAGRIVARALGERLGGTVVVENRVGAAGSVGVAQALRSPPDGHVMAVSGVSPTMLQHLLGRVLPYDPTRDLNPVGYLGSSGMVVVARRDSPFRTLAEVMAAARARPGAVTFGSAGITSPGHLATEYLTSMTGLRMSHVPYAGDAELMGDLLSGRIDVATVGIASVSSHLRSGTVAGLALTSRERLSTFPAMPTVAEAAGQPAYEADIWNLLVLPRGTPPEIDARLNAAVSALVVEPGVRDSLLNAGFTARPMSLPEIAAFVTAERAKWGKVLRDADIRVQ